MSVLSLRVPVASETLADPLAEVLGRVDNTWATWVNGGACFQEPRRARHALSPRDFG